MKKGLLYLIFLYSSLGCFAQAYIPMPTDSAIWRYRVYDEDYAVQVLDNIFYLNGQDTAANGNIYHKIMSRSCRQTGGTGFNPPVVTSIATSSDIVYSGMRESGKQVFLLSLMGEDLIYDFTVGVGDSIPAYAGKDQVTAIDSVLIDGTYHKRYQTTDTTYYVIEGIGSNRGLVPAMNDGSGTVVFYCFTDTPVTWSPDTTLPCTYVYRIGYPLAISNTSDPVQDITIYPMPASEVLHVSVNGASSFRGVIYDYTGQPLWRGIVNDGLSISVGSWPRGLYFLRSMDANSYSIIRNIVLE